MKTVFITGASSGIGESTAKLFASYGNRIILAARRTSRLESLKKLIDAQYPQSSTFCMQLDVQNIDEIRKTIKQLPKPFDSVDILINNAGNRLSVHCQSLGCAIGKDDVSDIPLSAINQMFDTNVKGLIAVTQAVLESMKRENKGHIINVGSIAGIECYPGGGVYCASKHAVDAITKTLRMELVSYKIKVSAVNPGLVETEFSNVRFGGDEEKAKKVYEGIEPLTGEDIARTIHFMASQPDHVQIADVLILPTNQASVNHIHRSK